MAMSILRMGKLRFEEFKILAHVLTYGTATISNLGVSDFNAQALTHHGIIHSSEVGHRRQKNI